MTLYQSTFIIFFLLLGLSPSLFAQTDTLEAGREAANHYYDIIGIIAEVRDTRQLDTNFTRNTNYLPQTEAEITRETENAAALRRGASCQLLRTEDGQFKLESTFIYPKGKEVDIKHPAALWYQSDTTLLPSDLTEGFSPLRSVSSSIINLKAKKSYSWKGRFPEGFPDSVLAGVQTQLTSTRAFQSVAFTRADIGKSVTIDTVELKLIAYEETYALFELPDTGDYAGNLIVLSEDENGYNYLLTGRRKENYVKRRRTYTEQLPTFALAPLLDGPLSREEYVPTFVNKIAPLLKEPGYSPERQPSYLFVRFVGPVTTFRLVSFGIVPLLDFTIPCPVKTVTPEQLSPRRSPFFIQRSKN